MQGLGLLTSDPVRNPCITFLISPKLNYTGALGSSGDWFQDPPWPPRSTYAQVPDIKWRRTVHRVSPPHLRIPKHRWKMLFLIHCLNLRTRNPEVQRADCIFIETKLMCKDLCCLSPWCSRVSYITESLHAQDQEGLRAQVWMVDGPVFCHL